MSPNLLVLANKAVKPHTWFQPTPEVPISRTEKGTEPVPGWYKYTPCRGWALVAIDKDDACLTLETPMPVAYCKLLHRFMFAEDLAARKRRGHFESPRTAHNEPLTFFVLDDGVTWVQCYDSNDDFIPGPYERFVLDADSLLFRPMCKADDPAWPARRAGSASSAVSSLYAASRPHSPSPSPAASRPGSAAGSRARAPRAGNTLEVPPSSSRASSQTPSSSSRASSRVRPVTIDELPRLQG